MGVMPGSSDDPPERSPVRFGTFVLDPVSLELRRNGIPVRLQGQPMQILLMLLENPGQVVTREEMQRRLWPADTFVEFDAGLNTAIKKVRQTLGDTAENPRFVETVPKIGYRFIAPVHKLVVSMPQAAPVEPAATVPVAASGKGFPWRIAAAASVVAVVILAVMLVYRRMAAPVGLPPTRFEITLPREQSLGRSYSRGIALSPNGRTLVYSALQAGQYRLFRREMNELESRPIPGTEDAWTPVFTPDGSRIGFTAGSEFRTMDLDGANPRTELRFHPDLTVGWGTAVWAPNGDLYFSDGPAQTGSQPTLALWVKTGESKRMLTGRLFGQPPEWHFIQQVLPGGKHILFSIVRTPDDRDIAVYSLETGVAKIVVRGGSGGLYLPTGHLVYSIFSKGRQLYAVPFDLDRLETTGAPIALVAVGHDGWRGPTVAVSESGTLVYRPAPAAEGNELTWVDLSGRATPLPVPPGPYSVLDISADGERLLIAKQEPASGQWQVWRYETRPGIWTRLPFGSITPPQGTWAPDGKRAVISAELHGSSLVNLYLVDFQGTAPIRVSESRFGQFPSAWSPVHNTLAFVEGTRPNQASEILVKRMGTPEPPRELFPSPGFESNPSFSPDGRWIAFASDGKVLVRAYPQGQRNFPVAEGSSGPLWSPDGRTIYVRRKGGVWAVSFTPGAEPAIGTPRVLFEGDYAMPDHWTRKYSLAPDGKRFLMVKLEQSPLRERSLHVVLNWFDELRRGQ